MSKDFSTLENLIELEDRSEAGIAQVLHERFKKHLNYTKASDVLVSVNDFSSASSDFDEDQALKNQVPNKQAHIFGVARNALAQISSKSSSSETIVFGGESGSGKSHNAFQVLKFLTSQKNSKVSTKQADAIRVVLQSFGCAKTLKNAEATRYGCSIDLLYQKSTLSGLNLKYTVPLEASRVISQKPGERNFNIFYEIYHGLNDDAKSSFGIRELQKFFYMNQGNPIDNIQTDEDKFDDVDNALSTLGFSEDHRLGIYKIVSIILHIGNLFFRMKRNPHTDSEHIEVGNPSEAKWIAFLMEIDYEVLVDAFLLKSSDSTTISINTALDNRDSLAMLLYEELFKWILSRISLHFKLPVHSGVISIIDNYGLERYNNNGLEEFLINSANERIENIFVKHTFHDHLVEYLKDGISVDYKVPSSIENGKVVELLFKKPYGLLPLLTDECKFPRGTCETYLDHCNLNHLDKSIYGKPRGKDRLEFGVRHCFGTTWYAVNDFFRKNKRSVPGRVVQTLRESRNAIISMLFRSLDVKDGSDHFVSQAHLTMKGTQELVQKINSSHAHFVRCIRSNNERLPMKFDIPMVHRQIKALLLAELLQFRILGYPVKIPKRVFARQYRCLLPGDIALCQNEKEIIQDILQGQGVKYENDFKSGNEYVFLRERLADRYETQQYKISRDAAIIIQKNIKTFVARKKFARKRAAIVKLQAALRGWRARRNYIVQREEMFKALGRTTKRNKRLAAYHQALEGEHLPEKLEPTTLVGYIDIDEDAKKVLERPTSTNNNSTYVVHKYLSVPIKNFLPNMKSVALEQYAEENFKGHLLEPRREPVMTPFLHKETEYDFRLSVEIFKLILKFMNDRKLSKAQRDDLGRYIVQQGISNPCQRDEIIVQTVNQTHNNNDKVAVEYGWKLIHMAISCFPPTENIIPMLIGVFNEQPAMLKEQLFSTLQRRLKIYDSEISRELPSSNLELAAIPAAFNTVAEVNCYDGQCYDVHLHPWTTNNEIAERILKHRGVGVALGWTVEVETPNRVFAPTGTHFIHDVFAQIDGVEIEDNKSVFFNFPPEKLVKPKPKEEPVVEEKPAPKSVTPVQKPAREYPPPEEWVKRPPTTLTPVEHVEHVERSEHRPPSQSRTTPRQNINEQVEDESDESLIREFNEDAEYCYTLPMKNKKKAERQEVEEEDEDYESGKDYEPIINRFENQEQPRQMQSIVDHSHILTSPQLPRKTYSRNEFEEYTPMNFAPPPTFSYPGQMPMMQYVPVMMTQPMMAGQQMAMIPQPIMMQPHYNYTPQYAQIPQYPAPVPSEIMSPQSVKSRRIDDYYQGNFNPHQDGHESVRSKGDSRRFRKGEVPSQYSTIRNMPVPRNTNDVDQFLDAVFDQVLSKDEQRSAKVDAKQLAATIKGGRRELSGQQIYEQESLKSPKANNNYHQGYLSPVNQYDDSTMRMRAKSLPRHTPPTFNYNTYERRPHSRNSYSAESTSSDDHQMDYRARSRERSLPRYNPDGSAQAYRPIQQNSQQPVYMMMPMQVNPNGEMILLSPVSTGYRSPSRNQSVERPRKHTRGVERYIAKRSPSVDGYAMKPPMIRRTPDGIERISTRPSFVAPSPAIQQISNRFEDPKTSFPRSGSRSKERMDAPIMTRQIPPRIDYQCQNGRSTNSFRSPSPAPDRKGLNRLPVETYTEPAVKSTTTNGEYLSPNRFNLDRQKEVIHHEKLKHQDALNKLNQQLKRVPPPVDNVRLIRPVTPTPRSPSPVPSERPVHHTPPPPPTPQPQPPQVREEWVINDFVERAPETQERIKGGLLNEPVLPILQKTPVVNEKPAVKYTKAPWKLTIRKEFFYPGEILNDIQIIDQVFAQIVEDCKKSYPYRIRLQDRKQVEDVLRVYKIPPTDLAHQTNIHPDVKVEVIDTARHWPLYFNQIYEVIEKRPNESVGILFAISEWGVRLIIHTPHDIENPLKIQDFFPFDTIVDVSLEANDIVAIHVGDSEANSYSTIRLKTNQAIQIKKTLEKCLTGGAVQKPKLVRALEDYVTNESNHLSFKKGDLIELLPAPEGDIPPAGDWLYGRIQNRFGYLLNQYVDSNYSENGPHLRFESNNDRDEHVKLFDDEVPFSSERYTMLDFATKYFRRPKERKRQEDWTWSDIAQAVKFTDKPILSSLLKDFGPEESKNAVETFTAIMQFMGDEPLKKNESITDVVFKILLISHRHPNLRDEVYCQLIKQTTSNTSIKPDSAIRGWRLFSIMTAYFPSSLTLKPYLLQYLSENADDVLRQYHGTARICQYNILQTFKYGGRKVLLNAMEVQLATDGKTIRRQPFFVARDHSVNQNLKTVTVAEEMIQELCNMLNVRSLSEQQEFSLCYSVGKEKRLHYCKNDDYLMDIITEMEHKKQSFQFYLKRTVWVHPLRLDNAAYIDSMFDQVIDDYLRGSTVSTNAFGQLTAATTEEIIKMAAYLFLLLPDHSKGLTVKNLHQVVPKTVIEPKHRMQEEMVNRINREVKHLGHFVKPAELKARFLELLSTWPLFGVSLYRLKSSVENGNPIPEVILLIGKLAVQLLQPKSQEVYKQWNYDQILSVESIKTTSFKSVRLVTGMIGQEKTLDVKTDESDEIAHLIGQYIYVTNERGDRSSTEL